MLAVYFSTDNFMDYDDKGNGYDSSYKAKLD